MSMPSARQFDFVLLGGVVLLTVVGAVLVFSSSAVLAERRFGDPYFFVRRQLVFLALGVLGMVVLAQLDVVYLQRLSAPLLVISLGLLALVLIPGIGYRVGGARRWIELGGWRGQTVELAKLALIIYFAKNLARHAEAMRDFMNGFLPNFLVLAVCVGLVMAQPDFGSALLLGGVAYVLFFSAGMRVRHIGMSLLIILPLLTMAMLSAEYRRRRLLTFLDPWNDPTESGFQIVQSFLAFGSGGVTGRGLGAGQQKLFFLPEAHTDFIFAIIGEELGLIGTIFVVAIFAVVLWRGARIALTCADPFARLLAFGMVTLLTVQATINMAVAVGMLPTKGLPLPFISLGGSSLSMALAATGILLSLSRGTR